MIKLIVMDLRYISKSLALFLGISAVIYVVILSAGVEDFGAGISVGLVSYALFAILLGIESSRDKRERLLRLVPVSATGVALSRIITLAILLLLFYLPSLFWYFHFPASQLLISFVDQVFILVLLLCLSMLVVINDDIGAQKQFVKRLQFYFLVLFSVTFVFAAFGPTFLTVSGEMKKSYLDLLVLVCIFIALCLYSIRAYRMRREYLQ